MSRYIHGTDPSEQQRLAALNRMSNKPFLDFLQPALGARVLEVGSGLGILAADLASANPGVQVTGVEQASAQLASAQRHVRVQFVQADAHRLPFGSETFDLVYTRYVLEHVADPLVVLREMRRVLGRDGRAAACENDVTLVRFDPPCPAFDRVWRAFQEHQHQLGGDSRVGRRLYALFHGAGFSHIELSVQPEVHWHGSPGFPAWIRNLIGNVESARHGLVAAGHVSEGQIDAAIDELSNLMETIDASSWFVWNRAVARR